jgi:HK97 family phage major capsid protein
MERLKEIAKRLKEIANILENDGEADVDELEQEVKDLQEEQRSILEKSEKRKALLSSIASKTVSTTLITQIGTSSREERSKELTGVDSVEYRDAFFRSIGNRRITNADAKILEVGKRAAHDYNGDGVPEGSEYLIPGTTKNQIVDVIKQYGQVYSAVTKTTFNGEIYIPIGRLKGKIKNDDGTFRLEFAFDNIKISQGAIIGTITIKNILLKNSISALEAYLVKQIGLQIALQLDNGVINGDGDSFTGILEKLEPRSYSTVGWDLVVDIEHSLKQAYSATAGFVMNWATFGKFRKIRGADNLPIASSVPIIMGNGYSVPYTLDNKPVLIVDPIIVGDGDILYGNLEAYNVNESQGMVIESDTSPEFIKDKTVWRGKVYSGGEPVLSEENFVLFCKDDDMAETPTIIPSSGAVDDGAEITLTSATEGAVFYYTTDGSIPTKKSQRYNEKAKPVVNGTMTFKAIASKVGMKNSDPAEATYTIKA